MIDVATEHLLTLAAAARYLKTTPRTLSAWIASGKLDGVALPNGRWRTSLEALARMAAPARSETLAGRGRRAEDVAERLKEMGV